MKARSFACWLRMTLRHTLASGRMNIDIIDDPESSSKKLNALILDFGPIGSPQKTSVVGREPKEVSARCSSLEPVSPDKTARLPMMLAVGFQVVGTGEKFYQHHSRH